MRKMIVAALLVATPLVSATEPEEIRSSLREEAAKAGWDAGSTDRALAALEKTAGETGEEKEAFKIVRAGLRSGLNAEEISALLQDARLAVADGATLHEVRHVVKKALKEGGLATAKEALASYRALVAEGVDPHEARKSVLRAFKGKDKDDDDDKDKDKRAEKLAEKQQERLEKQREREEELREKAAERAEKLREKREESEERARELREELEKRLEEKRLERKRELEEEREKRREEEREERRDRDEDDDEHRSGSSGSGSGKD